MTALFPRWSNTAYGLAVATLAGTAAASIGIPMLYVRTPYGTHEHRMLEQPIAFDHRHHVRDDGIQCLYCHDGAASRAHAGIPATEVCMGCHAQIWPESSLLAPVRASYFEDTPIAWRKLYVLPDFVYFHHGVHVQHGIACARCHGRVEDMARVSRAVPLTMDFCLDCHRDPPAPRDQGSLARGFAQVEARGAARAQNAGGFTLNSLTTCSACHR
jgi:predicted CXXCH cytochrome family protein